MARRFQDVWEDQCKAAEGIAARFGTVQASTICRRKA
jgi:hypothetical protein